MRPAGQIRRAVSAPLPSSARLGMRGLSVLALAVAVACRGDSVVQPGDRLVHSDPPPALAGAAGPPVFPTMPPGEQQPRGFAVGLNGSGQVTGGARGMLPGDAGDGNKPFRWTPEIGHVKLTSCCGNG